MRESMRQRRSWKNTTASVVAILFIATGGAVSQSTDRNHPARLTSGELAGRISQDDRGDSFYSFIAGPGEVKLSVNVVSKDARVDIEVGLYSLEGKRLLSVNVVGKDSKSGRASGHIEFSRAQTVVMRVARGHSSGSAALYKIQLKGAVSFG